jgi:hypothetical protein
MDLSRQSLDLSQRLLTIRLYGSAIVSPSPPPMAVRPQERS